MNSSERFAFDGTTSNNTANISIELPEVRKDEKASVSYNGILTSTGADKVYLHYGYDGWNGTETVPMKKDASGGYTAEIKVKGQEELNFCFKDNANNWDNNNGSDWKVDINS